MNSTLLSPLPVAIYYLFAGHSPFSGYSQVPASHTDWAHSGWYGIFNWHHCPVRCDIHCRKAFTTHETPAVLQANSDTSYVTVSLVTSSIKSHLNPKIQNLSLRKQGEVYLPNSPRDMDDLQEALPHIPAPSRCRRATFQAYRERRKRQQRSAFSELQPSFGLLSTCLAQVHLTLSDKSCRFPGKRASRPPLACL